MARLARLVLPALLALLELGGASAHAASAAQSNGYCDPQGRLTAEHKDRLFRFAAVIKGELERSGAALALIARSGLDLSRFQVRYSHAGLALKASPETRWAVRQLYYACDEKLPRIFDQGMSAFLLGTDRPELGYVSVLLLPEERAASLERAALDNRVALRFLHPSYSANAFPFSVKYQNCNQWLAEMMAAAWGGIGSQAEGGIEARLQAQRWLHERGYAPSVVDVGWRVLMWAGAFVPWIHSDDHPAEDLQATRYRISMPASLEAFARAQVPGATRIEFCHDSHRIVVRRGWEPIAEGCVPGSGDEVVTLDD